MWCLLTTCWSPYRLKLWRCCVLTQLKHWAWDLKPDDFLSPLRLMCDLRNPNLSCIQLWHCVISSLIAWACHNVSLATQTRSCTPWQTVSRLLTNLRTTSWVCFLHSCLLPPGLLLPLFLCLFLPVSCLPLLPPSPNICRCVPQFKFRNSGNFYLPAMSVSVYILMVCVPSLSCWDVSDPTVV